ncbi:unnamed protein product [Didymodactylos carnosus]|uniref:Uncharacterized protein n=1 Tax=Didymodactylos carnosus TaxID=1234261 RepID=A0A8S2DH38_9BILA|nr:unnamed protein product [Didymodactylos carnosus]CAF3674460.1 unnamed protein product [Didymodactylos carnosus]
MSLLCLKNAEWINRVSPETYDALMRRIIEELVQHACQLEDRLIKVDYSLKNPHNVSVAQVIVEKIESMRDLERSVPELEKHRKNVLQRFLQCTQAAFDRIQKTFNLQNKDVYLIKQELKNLEEIKKECDNLHPARIFLQKHEYSDIITLNREIEQLKTKQKVELQEAETQQYDMESKSESLNSIVQEYMNLSRSETDRSVAGKLPSIIEKEKTRIIVERGKNKQLYHFSDRLDGRTANNALIYLNQCEKVGQSRVKESATDTIETLREYLSEYGNFLNQEISNNFIYVCSNSVEGAPIQSSQDLEMRLQELSSLNRFPDVFECIDGLTKVGHWHREFLKYHRTLDDKMKAYEDDKRYKELNDQLIIAHALKLYYISRGDYANADIALSDIHDDPLHPSDKRQIQHDLQSSLNKLMNNTKSIVNWLDGKIEREEDNRSQTQEIKENIDKIRIALNKHSIVDLLDDGTRNDPQNFDIEINEILFRIFLRGLDSIGAFMDADSFSEAEQGMENLSRVQRELAGYCTSKCVTEKSEELRERVNCIVSEILKRSDFADVNNYSVNPPKDLLAKLRMVASHGSARFTQAYNSMLGKVRQSFSLAINEVRNAPLHERGVKIRSLNYALYFLPEDLQTYYKLQIDELSKLITDEEKAHKQDLDALFINMNENEHAITKLGELADRFRKQSLHELFNQLREQSLKKLHMYRTNVQTSLDKQDIQSAVSIIKKISMYEESLGTYIPEKDKEFFPENELQNAEEGFQKMSQYLYENSKKCQPALEEMDIIELSKVMLNYMLSDETTKFEIKREEFFSNLMRTIEILRAINLKFKDILSSTSEVDKLQDLKTKIERISEQLITKASRKELSPKDADDFRSLFLYLISIAAMVIELFRTHPLPSREIEWKLAPQTTGNEGDLDELSPR